MLRRLLLFLALLFCAVHLAFLPHTLEDIDSVNFALGVESFDVAKHQPHPPGYPVYIALTKLSTSAIAIMVPGWDRDRRAAAGIAIWSVVFGALALFALTDFWRLLGLAPPVAATASIVTVTAPLFWFMAARPLTDVPGLVAAVAVQGRVLTQDASHFRGRATTGLPREWLWAAAGAGFVAGLRVQTLLLTGPLLLWAAGALVVVRRRIADTGKLAAAAAAGVLVWAVPLLWDSGGLGGYLRALGGQGQQDFAEVSMLATTPSWRLLQQTMHHTFVDPWTCRLSHVVGGLALIGLVRMVWKRWPRRRAAARRVLALPDLPLSLSRDGVRPLCAATARAGLWPRRRRAVGTGHEGRDRRRRRDRRCESDHRAAAPAGLRAQCLAGVRGVPRHAACTARAVARQRDAAAAHTSSGLARRQAHDGLVPAHWDVGPQPFPSDREWQRLVRHWVSGGTEPVWLLGDLVAQRRAAL